MDQLHINDIAGFLDAYTVDEVKEAFKVFAAKIRGDHVAWKKRMGADELIWRQLDDGIQTQEKMIYIQDNGLDWRIIKDKLMVREPIRTPLPTDDIQNDNVSEGNPKPKTDLSMQQTDKTCMYCGGALAWEPICPGCRLGKLGFRGRFVCMEDMDHEFYVLREGVVLPNQDDMSAVN